MLIVRFACIIGAFAMSSAATAQTQQPSPGLPPPGRPVARIVSPAWDNEPSRDSAGEFAAVTAAAGIKPGMTVADIGAGSGYYTTRLSAAVGPQGQVLAQDVVKRYLDALARRVREEKLTNVRFVRGTQSNPRLPAGSVDVALMVHMYHEITQPYALLHRLRTSLKPGGRIAIVDLDRDPENHGMPRDLLVCEVRAVGYELVKITDLAAGYLAVFKLGPPKAPQSVKACRR
ncbi:methyltransferase type 11 [Polymorphobacter multimanifer]|uniref:Putative methyltransferase n=1 Tax=Polymorphobacter multimanifer TaxID=1070431 RepID=A0A841L5V6_9SPHN|nr:methyltransferase domain-containing protein [Polymorphobacter multimanifer]MBB6227636.1 putative methyltransferase [Polymorphobacter multimanifer]GGI75065.1 methyltransferase type 11 [Polymorphobacter multimanifer]